MKRQTPADYRRMPWKNGLGSTTELVRVDGPDGELDWRVSIADVVADGPFSRFAGCDRVIATIEGAGMALRHPAMDHSVSLGPLDPYSFSGDWETVCTLRSGAVRDFNLITRRRRFAGGVAVVRLDGGEVAGLPAATVLLYCLTGRLTIADATRALELAPGESVLRAGGESTFTAAAREPSVGIAVSILAAS